MTNQELYDTVIERMNAQGGPSLSDTMCLYRGPNGRKCAVGCLIDDKHYNETFESHPLSNPVVRDAVERSIGDLSPDQWKLLAVLQSRHDVVWREGEPFPDDIGLRHKYGIK